MSSRPVLPADAVRPLELKRCSRCGAQFGCGAASGACWCAGLPPLPLASLSSEDCLCPTCMAQVTALAPEDAA